MADQQLGDKFKDCLWRAHGRRCIYCENPILFVETEVDHVIPKYLLNDPKKFENIKKEYGLEKSFKIDGFENLAPSCSSCNSGKGTRTFTIGQIAIFLAKIKTRQELLTQCLEKKEKLSTLDHILVTIGKHIEEKVFSRTELFDALKKTGHIDFLDNSQPDFNISSKTIVNASQNVVQKETPVVFSNHALHSMKLRQISTDEVIAALKSGVRVENISVPQNETNRLTNKIRTHDGLVIIFEEKDGILWVVTVY